MGSRHHGDEGGLPRPLPRRAPGVPGVDGWPGGCAAAAGAGAGLGSWTCAPSRSRSPPSVTTTSPGLSPALTATLSPSTTPNVTGRTETERSALTRYTKVDATPLGAPRRTAEFGMMT